MNRHAGKPLQPSGRLVHDTHIDRDSLPFGKAQFLLQFNGLAVNYTV